MAKPRNPNAKLYTVQIPQELIGYLRCRSDDMDLSMPQYVAKLIREDQINAGRPRIDYPLSYDGPPLSIAAETPPPYLSKKK
jgi:hypothetical protein